MGEIRKNSSGNWFVDVMIDGKRYRKVISKDKRLAELALKDIELKAERRELGFLERREISIKKFFEEFQQYSEANHRRATQTRYKAVVQNFLKFLEYKEPYISALRRVTVDLIERYRIYRRTTFVARNGRHGAIHKVNFATVTNGAKASTVNFELTALRTMFYHAVKVGYLDNNPARGIKRLKTDDSKQRRFLSEEECRLLLQSCSVEQYPIFFAFLNTGMRRAELVNLEWSDIDLDKRTLKIQRKSFWLPKAGERTIPINEPLHKVLSRLPRVSNFVFVDDAGMQLRPNEVRKHLIAAAKKAAIFQLSEVHALRHTFASQLLMKGVDLPTVQKLMGHNRIETTMIYTHQTADHLSSSVSKLTY